MLKYFIKHKIIFLVIMFIIFFFSLFYYIISKINYNKNKDQLINIDSILNDIIAIYVDSYLKYVRVKKESVNYLNFEILKNYSIDEFYSKNLSNITFRNETYSSNNISILENLSYKLKVPDRAEVSINILGNILNSFLDNIDTKNKNLAYKNLYEIYYGNICSLIIDNYNFINDFCYSVWNGILLKGFDQAILQLSLSLYELLDSYEIINKKLLNIKNVTNFPGILGEIDIFVNYILLQGYEKTYILINEIRIGKMNKIKTSFKYIISIFIILEIFLIIISFIIIYFEKSIFLSFLNFIGILPLKYLFENEIFYNEILKLQKSIFD